MCVFGFFLPFLQAFVCQDTKKIVADALSLRQFIDEIIDKSYNHIIIMYIMSKWNFIKLIG